MIKSIEDKSVRWITPLGVKNHSQVSGLNILKTSLLGGREESPVLDMLHFNWLWTSRWGHKQIITWF